MLSRIYGAPGGTEALDVLMKYMYVHRLVWVSYKPHRPPASTGHHAFQHLPRATVVHPEIQTNESTCSYKGMAQGAPSGTKRDITPQPTGFSQIHTRGGGEGGGQAMSVLLSWHEKVRPHAPSSLFETSRPPGHIPRSPAPHLSFCFVTDTPQLVEIAGPGSISRVMSDRRTV